MKNAAVLFILCTYSVYFLVMYTAHFLLLVASTILIAISSPAFSSVACVFTLSLFTLVLPFLLTMKLRQAILGRGSVDRMQLHLLVISL